MPVRAFTSGAEIVRLTLASIQVLNAWKHEDHTKRTERDGERPAVLPRFDFLHPDPPILRRPLRKAICAFRAKTDT
ncbi:hypothetical protein GCM10010495_17290 [Kitasatospora herbaricolor]|nr:hypothetical protein GCM10010495_17290 [Kitasatospora herbaricolor]